MRQGIGYILYLYFILYIMSNFTKMPASPKGSEKKTGGKGIGTTKTHTNVGAKAGVPKTGAYKGAEVMNESVGAKGGGKAYKGEEVHKNQPVRKVKPRKSIAMPNTPNVFMPTGNQGMYK
jgi:hypothetical protein